MKNIFLGLIFWKWIPAFAGMTMLVFLPQASFAADAKYDAQSVAFFQQQADERAVFIKANPVLIAKQDAQGRWLMAQKDAQSAGKTFSESAPPTLTSDEQSTFDAFVAKQQSDKQAFFRNWPRKSRIF